MSHEPPGNGAHPPHARPQFCLQSAEISSEPWTLISASSFLLPSSRALEKSKLSHGIHAALMGLSSCTRTVPHAVHPQCLASLTMEDTKDNDVPRPTTPTGLPGVQPGSSADPMLAAVAGGTMASDVADISQVGPVVVDKGHIFVGDRPALAAMDMNKDGILDADDLVAYQLALSKAAGDLDADQDGVLTVEEARQARVSRVLSCSLAKPNASVCALEWMPPGSRQVAEGAEERARDQGCADCSGVWCCVAGSLLRRVGVRLPPRATVCEQTTPTVYGANRYKLAQPTKTDGDRLVTRNGQTVHVASSNSLSGTAHELSRRRLLWLGSRPFNAHHEHSLNHPVHGRALAGEAVQVEVGTMECSSAEAAVQGMDVYGQTKFNSAYRSPPPNEHNSYCPCGRMFVCAQ